MHYIRKFRKNSKSDFTNKLVVDLDCVGRGDLFFVFPGNEHRKTASISSLVTAIKKEAVRKDKACVFAYDCKHCERGNHSCFPNSAGICAVLTEGTHRFGITGIGTSRDDSWDEDNLNLLSKALRHFVEQY
jgi:hypothetical protein